MWPWFATPRDRGLNRWLLARQLKPVIRQMGTPPVVVTTLPIVADLVGAIPAARWVYYCVDDFSLWPGLEGAGLRRMEEKLVRRADDEARERLPTDHRARGDRRDQQPGERSLLSLLQQPADPELYREEQEEHRHADREERRLRDGSIVGVGRAEVRSRWHRLCA